MYYTWVTLIFIIWVLSLKVESQSWYSNPCSGHVLTPSIVTVERSGLGHYLLNKINRLGHIFIFFFAYVIIWPPTSNISLRNLFSWYVFTWAQNSLYIIDNSKNYLDNLSKSLIFYDFVVLFLICLSDCCSFVDNDFLSGYS